MAKDRRSVRDEGGAEYLEVARSQLDGVDDHCETARRELEDLRGSLTSSSDEEPGPNAVSAALDERPRLAEQCRAIRTNTFDALERQLSKLVATDPGAAGDLSPGRIDDSVQELGQHHRRLMAAIERLEGIARADRFDRNEARRAVEDGLQAIDHLESTAALLRCLLAKAAPVPSDAGPATTAGSPASDTEFAVRGTITHGDAPLEGVTVRAFDRDVSGEQQLGEATTDDAGTYRVGYEESDFANAERGTADVVVRVFDRVDTRIAESSVHYNVSSETTVDVRVPPEREVEPSEYALLRDDLDRLLGDQSITDLDDDGMEFLEHELGLGGRDRFPAGAETVHVLRRATELASKSPFAVRTLYALFRTTSGGDREGLARSDASQLAEQVRTADAENVVDVRTQGLEDRLARNVDQLQRILELENSEEVHTTVAVRTAEDEPLDGTKVRIQDPTDERKRRTFTTDEEGRITFSYMVSPEAQDRSRGFDLTVLNDGGVTLHEERVSVTEGSVTEVVVPEFGSGFAGSETLDSLRSGRGIQLPRPGGDGDLTLGAVRRAGGVENLDGSEMGRDDQKRLDGTASLDLLTGPETSQELLRGGYTDQYEIAGTPFEDFRSSMDGTLDPQQAAAVHATARAQTYLIDSMTVDRLAGVRNGTTPVDDDMLDGVEEVTRNGE